MQRNAGPAARREAPAAFNRGGEEEGESYDAPPPSGGGGEACEDGGESYDAPPSAGGGGRGSGGGGRGCEDGEEAYDESAPSAPGGGGRGGEEGEEAYDESAPSAPGGGGRGGEEGEEAYDEAAPSASGGGGGVGEDCDEAYDEAAPSASGGGGGVGEDCDEAYDEGGEGGGEDGYDEYVPSGPRPPEADALWQATKEGNEAEVRRLLSLGLDVNGSHSYMGTSSTALYEAAERHHHAIAEVLLEAGADMEARDSYYKQTPLLVAASMADAPMILLLARHRSGPPSLAVVNSNKQNAFHLAAELNGGGGEVCKALMTLPGGFEALNAHTESGSSALRIAIWRNRLDFVRAAIDAHVNVNEVTKGQTPLALALSVQGPWGSTPTSLGHNSDMEKLLRSAGARL